MRISFFTLDTKSIFPIISLLLMLSVLLLIISVDTGSGL